MFPKIKIEELPYPEEIFPWPLIIFMMDDAWYFNHIRICDGCFENSYFVGNGKSYCMNCGVCDDPESITSSS